MNVPSRWKTVLASAIVLLSSTLAGCAATADAVPVPPLDSATPADLVYVATQSTQLRALRFDAASGKLSPVGIVAEGLRPTWLVDHPRLPVLYAVNEDVKHGSVTAYAVNRATGALTRLSQVSAGGNGTTHLWLDVPSSTLLAANYTSGTTSSIAVNGDGSLGALVSTVRSTGSGPSPRQATPHAHGVVVDPSGRYALVADLGADRVFIYPLDPVTHALSPDDAAHPRSYVAPAGSGPRHLAFGADGRYLYLINELTAEITTLRWDAQQGQLTRLQSLPTSSDGFTGTKSGAEVAVSGDGRFVYVGNRGEHMLVAYRVDPDSGLLTLLQRIGSGGETPWGLALHPSGKWMLVANQRSGRISVFSVDPATGLLADTGLSAALPTPVGVRFVN